MPAGRGPALEVEGARQLRASLKAAGVGVDDLKKAHKEVAELVASRARVPHVTGALEATVRAAGTATAAIVRAGNNSRVRYANPIHWGWPHRHIRAALFFTDAVRENEAAELDIYLRALEALIATVEGAPIT